MTSSWRARSRSTRPAATISTGSSTGCGLTYVPSHTNFVLLHIGPAAKAVFQALLERGVIVRPCAAYELPEHLRITVGTEAQNARFIAALEEVLDLRATAAG